MRLRYSLTKKGSLNELIQQLEEYEKKLDSRFQNFLSRLMDVGIEVAKAKLGDYEGYVEFRKEISENEGILIATDGEKILKEWYTNAKKTQKRSYEISPLLMKEFGSGWLAVVMSDIPGVGQGTMPNSYGHANDPNGWYWYDEDGKKHHSIGEAPTFPMYSAAIEMMREIDNIAKETLCG